MPSEESCMRDDIRTTSREVIKGSHHPRDEYGRGGFSRLWGLYDASRLKNFHLLHAMLKSTIDFEVAALSRLIRWHFPQHYAWYQKLAMISGQYENAVGEVVRSALRPGMNCIDGGAHIGYFSLLFSRLVGPKGIVYAMEPHPENFALLVKNIRKSRYSNIVPIQLALSGNSGDIELFESTSSTEHSIYRLNKKASGKVVPIKAVSLDDFLDEQGNPSISLVKIDIQGAELAVLQGAQHLLRNAAELSLIVEVAPLDLSRAGIDPSEILQLLRSYGFDIYVIEWRGGCTKLDDQNLISYAKEVEYINILAKKS
jgi:FkbM family methyltransferase